MGKILESIGRTWHYFAESLPDFSEETRKAKRNALAAASASILVWAFSVQLTRLSITGLELTAAGNLLNWALGAGVIYFASY